MKQEEVMKYNRRIFPFYKGFGWDPLFYSAIIFLFLTEVKGKQIDSLKIDIMIEDSPETIPTFVKHTHVFCYDCRYNRDMKLDNMTRVFSWYDIYMKIQKFKNI